MKPMPTMLGMLCVGCLLVAGGCGDQLPSPPTAADGEVPGTLAVVPGDMEEVAVVTAMEKARVNYDYRLEVLKAHFLRRGDLDRYRWACREHENLRSVMAPAWENAPAILPPVGERAADADTRTLVEDTVAARREFLVALDHLAEFYEKRDPTAYKAHRTHNMQARFDPVRTYLYFLDAEIPGPNLRPTDVISDADQLFEAAIEQYHKGKILPGITDYGRQRQALMKLQQLVRRHPTSTKIALAAYYIGEIYKEYFDEDVRAVHWYERAWQWDPHITEPARFQAAVLYDYRLDNNARALELYRESLKFDPWRLGNSEFAEARISDLAEQERPKSPPGPPPAE